MWHKKINPFLLWIGSLIVFFCCLGILSFVNEGEVLIISVLIVLGLSFFVGVGSFLLMTIQILKNIVKHISPKHITEKNNDKREVVIRFNMPKPNVIFALFLVVFGIYFFSYFLINSFAQSNGLTKKDLFKPHEWFTSEVKVTENLPITPTLTLEPTKINKVTAVPKKTNLQTGEAMVNCKMNVSCGGDVRYIKKSECDNGTCCQIGSSWIFYISKANCIQDQGARNNNNKLVPTYAPKVYSIPTVSLKSYTPPTSPTIALNQPTSIPTNIPIPTVNQQQVDATNAERISRCKGDCIRTVDSYITSYRVSCRSGGCNYAILDSRDSLVLDCQSRCN